MIWVLVLCGWKQPGNVVFWGLSGRYLETRQANPDNTGIYLAGQPHLLGWHVPMTVPQLPSGPSISLFSQVDVGAESRIS
jgi:hypothetical protein